jgi:hypothetical protein
MATGERSLLLPQVLRRHSDAGAQTFVQRCWPALPLSVAVILVSAALINFNKYLIHKDRFPFPVALVMMHTGFSGLFCLLLLLARPSLFPSLTDPASKVDVGRGFIVARALPVALFFTGQLVLSNSAYAYASVAFLQMLKESNVVLVYVLSVACMLETFKMRNAAVLLMIVFATSLTVKGELHFSMAGFAIQGMSCVFESSKILIQGALLSGSENKLDPLSFVMTVSPLCFGMLSLLAVFHHAVHPMAFIHLPVWADMVNNRHLLAVNVLLAFSLNVVIAFFMKHASAIAFVIVGIVKDAMIVLASAKILQDPISEMQACGFTMQLIFVAVWSLMKTFPEKFEAGVAPGIHAILRGDLSKGR